jgi:hypothetical protein
VRAAAGIPAAAHHRRHGLNSLAIRDSEVVAAADGPATACQAGATAVLVFDTRSRPSQPGKITSHFAGNEVDFQNFGCCYAERTTMLDDLPANLHEPEAINCQRCGKTGARMCRLEGTKRSHFIVGLCNSCIDHFMMLDCLTDDITLLKAEADKRIEEAQHLRQKHAGRWRRKSVRPNR